MHRACRSKRKMARSGKKKDAQSGFFRSKECVPYRSIKDVYSPVYSVHVRGTLSSHPLPTPPHVAWCVHVQGTLPTPPHWGHWCMTSYQSVSQSVDDISYSYSFSFSSIIYHFISPQFTHTHTQSRDAACNSAKISQSKTKSHQQHSSGSRVKVKSDSGGRVSRHAVMHSCIQYKAPPSIQPIALGHPGSRIVQGRQQECIAVPWIAGFQNWLN